jgi:HD-GYP domain-containing protein (c-di-GMP phosphodiesterase class II)
MGTIASVVFAALTIVLALLWLGERRRARLLAVGEGRRVTQIGELERTAREAEAQAARARDELHREQTVRRQLVHDRDVAREWTRQLRHELAEAHSAAGTLGDMGNPCELVLRVAVQLLGAEKGVLLSRSDGDGDGDLDLAAAQGFHETAAENTTIQRLAKQTLSAQETLRQDEGDGEIENLVAIPVYIQDRFDGVVVAANKPGGFNDYDDEVLLALGDHAGAVLQNARLHGRLRNAYVATVRVLAEAIEAKDPFLRGHCDEVSDLVLAVARKLELGPKEREELVFASLLHDIGKIGISERILMKPGPLTQEERAIVQLHPRIGYRLVEQVPELKPIALAVLHHHERWDGRGYPSRLKADAIPREARLIAIADSFSAMISERPYGTRMTPEEACEELKLNAGTQFDPELVELFCEEVARRGEQLLEPGAFDRALDDPELQHQRIADEPVLGAAAFAKTDSATLLYSHRHFREELQARAKAAGLNKQPFAVLVLELVDLNRINRDEGWDVGDAALYQVAREAELLATRTGGVAARISGRRIAILVPGAGEDEAKHLAEELAPDVSLRVACGAWREGDDGDDVLGRARASFRLSVGG